MSHNFTIRRIVLDGILIIGLFVFPWWLIAALALLGLIVWSNYWEFLIVFACADILYRGGISNTTSLLAMALVIGVFAANAAIRSFLRERAISI